MLNSDIVGRLIRTSFTFIPVANPSITIPLGVYWLLIGETRYARCSIWYVNDGNTAPISVVNICNEEMTKSITGDKMTLKWKYAANSYVLLIRINN